MTAAENISDGSLQVTYREITSRSPGNHQWGCLGAITPGYFVTNLFLGICGVFQSQSRRNQYRVHYLFCHGTMALDCVFRVHFEVTQCSAGKCSASTKIKLPSWIIILAPLLATQLLHLMGFLLVCVTLKIFGYEIHLLNTVMCVIPLLMLGALYAFSISMIFASINVFVRDVSQVIPQLLALTFFLTPIMYSSEVIPKKYLSLMAYNPVTPGSTGYEAWCSG